jgi:hypothetical protein
MRATLSVILLVLSVFAFAQAAPSTMTYQGILKSSTGLPVSDGSYSVTFSIFNVPSGGAALWIETQSVTTVSGLLTTTLGQFTPIPDSAVAGTAAYLQVAIASDPPLSPRTRLSSTPYSMVSSSVRGKGPVQLAVTDVTGEEVSTYDLSATPSSAGAAGKNIRKQITVSLLSNSASSEEFLGLDSGQVSHLLLHDGDDTLGLTEIVHLPGASGLHSGQAVAIPAFMKNARKAKTAEASESREILDPDSGYGHRVVLQSNADSTEKSITLNPPISGGVAVPKFLDITKDKRGSESARSRETLDADSGYNQSVVLRSANDSTERSITLNPPISGGVAIPKFLDITKDKRGSESARSRQTLDADSGYNQSVVLRSANDSTERSITLNPPISGGVAIPKFLDITKDKRGSESARSRQTLSSSLSRGTSQTREHVLLARQTSVSGAGTNSRQIALETGVDSAGMLLQCASGDTQGVEIVVSDTGQSITLSTTTAATKWPNIVLKKGLTSSEMSISHPTASPSSQIYASVDGASGARLGINTATPTLAFQLVGSGCYTGSFGVCSDRRFKEHIATLTDPLTTVQKLRGVQFEWRRTEFPGQDFPAGSQLGLIAQEVESVIPGIVNTGADGYKSVDYAKLVPLLIEAIKDQQRQIDRLKSRLDISESDGEKPVVTTSMIAD